jgi:acetolactate synthase-1/2/3 large subunit
MHDPSASTNHPSHARPRLPATITRAHEILTGAQIIWETLVREGVEVVFGYPGGAILPAYDALAGFPIRHVLVRHEQGAAHMADGYARASGRVGVAVATSGPGATNLVTGIATAKMDSVPLVCITGQVASNLLGTSAFQETDITSITRPITKESILVTRAADIEPAIVRAMRLAKSGRPGPVLVDITKDAQQATAGLEPHQASPSATRSALPDERAIDQALKLLGAAERPIILSGHGVTLAGATDLLLELVERTNIPVASTLLGLGAFPASHPRHLGMMGMHGEAWVNQAIQEADLLIAIGMRFDDRVTGEVAGYAPKAKKIHIELDPREIGKIVPVDVGIVADAAEALLRIVPRAVAAELGAWHARIADLKDAASTRDIQLTPEENRFHAAHVIHDLWRITRGRAIVVTDVGQHQMWEAQYYRHERPRTLITSGGLGTMGFALPAAIGARLACPDEEIWVIAGDGGFQMTACELATLAQERIKLNIAIVHNGYLGMVRQWQEMFYDGRYVATPLTSPDFVGLARAHGLDGIRVESRRELPAAVATARSSPRTVLLEFRVEEEDSVYPMVPSGADLGSMIRRPVP